jgi:DNA-binding ferritin-like protein (Dps family)
VPFLVQKSGRLEHDSVTKFFLQNFPKYLKYQKKIQNFQNVTNYQKYQKISKNLFKLGLGDFLECVLIEKFIEFIEKIIYRIYR